MRLRRKAGSRRYDVAFYVPWIGPLLTPSARAPTGGAETQIFLLAEALALRGVKVCLVVFELPGITLPSSIAGVAVSVRPPYRTHERFGRLRETISLARAVIDVDADVLVTRSAGPDVGLAALFAKFAGRRFVYSSANVSDFAFSVVSPKRLNQFLYRLGIRLADQLIVQTEEQVPLCKETFGRTPLLIRSIAESASRGDRDAEAFLWIGRVVWYKQPLAFVELARSLPEANFWMVAVPSTHDPDGPKLTAALEQAAAAVPNLELLAPRPRSELMELVGRAVAVVNTADFEGMPNIFLEGWARGVPALALTHDPDTVIERYGLGAFAHGSSGQLVDLAKGLWNERQNQSVVAARCRQYIVDHHSPEVISARWQEVLGIAPTATIGEAAVTQ